MSPEYIEELADLADPDRLWRLAGMEQMNLPTDKRKQLDTGVALRRHASHVRQLRELLKSRRSMLITPLSENGSAVMSVDTPEEHARLRDIRSSSSRDGIPARVTAEDYRQQVQALLELFDLGDAAGLRNEFDHARSLLTHGTKEPKRG